MIRSWANMRPAAVLLLLLLEVASSTPAASPPPSPWRSPRPPRPVPRSPSAPSSAHAARPPSPVRGYGRPSATVSTVRRFCPNAIPTHRGVRAPEPPGVPS